jgi:hypothetical protein
MEVYYSRTGEISIWTADMQIFLGKFLHVPTQTLRLEFIKSSRLKAIRTDRRRSGYG